MRRGAPTRERAASSSGRAALRAAAEAAVDVRERLAEELARLEGVALELERSLAGCKREAIAIVDETAVAREAAAVRAEQAAAAADEERGATVRADAAAAEARRLEAAVTRLRTEASAAGSRATAARARAADGAAAWEGGAPEREQAELFAQIRLDKREKALFEELNRAQAELAQAQSALAALAATAEEVPEGMHITAEHMEDMADPEKARALQSAAAGDMEARFSSAVDFTAALLRQEIALLQGVLAYSTPAAAADALAAATVAGRRSAQRLGGEVRDAMLEVGSLKATTATLASEVDELQRRVREIGVATPAAIPYLLQSPGWQATLRRVAALNSPSSSSSNSGGGGGGGYGGARTPSPDARLNEHGQMAPPPTAVASPPPTAIDAAIAMVTKRAHPAAASGAHAATASNSASVSPLLAAALTAASPSTAALISRALAGGTSGGADQSRAVAMRRSPPPPPPTGRHASRSPTGSSGPVTNGAFRRYSRVSHTGPLAFLNAVTSRVYGSGATSHTSSPPLSHGGGGGVEPLPHSSHGGSVSHDGDDDTRARLRLQREALSHRVGEGQMRAMKAMQKRLWGHRRNRAAHDTDYEQEEEGAARGDDHAAGDEAAWRPGGSDDASGATGAVRASSQRRGTFFGLYKGERGSGPAVQARAAGAPRAVPPPPPPRAPSADAGAGMGVRPREPGVGGRLTGIIEREGEGDGEAASWADGRGSADGDGAGATYGGGRDDDKSATAPPRRAPPHRRARDSTVDLTVAKERGWGSARSQAYLAARSKAVKAAGAAGERAVGALPGRSQRPAAVTAGSNGDHGEDDAVGVLLARMQQRGRGEVEAPAALRPARRAAAPPASAPALPPGLLPPPSSTGAAAVGTAATVAQLQASVAALIAVAPADLDPVTAQLVATYKMVLAGAGVGAGTAAAAPAGPPRGAAAEGAGEGVARAAPPPPTPPPTSTSPSSPSYRTRLPVRVASAAAILGTPPSSSPIGTPLLRSHEVGARALDVQTAHASEYFTNSLRSPKSAGASPSRSIARSPSTFALPSAASSPLNTAAAAPGATGGEAASGASSAASSPPRSRTASSHDPAVMHIDTIGAPTAARQDGGAPPKRTISVQRLRELAQPKRGTAAAARPISDAADGPSIGAAASAHRYRRGSGAGDSELGEADAADVAPFSEADAAAAQPEPRPLQAAGAPAAAARTGSSTPLTLEQLAASGPSSHADSVASGAPSRRRSLAEPHLHLPAAGDAAHPPPDAGPLHRSDGAFPVREPRQLRRLPSDLPSPRSPPGSDRRRAAADPAGASAVSTPHAANLQAFVTSLRSSSTGSTGSGMGADGARSPPSGFGRAGSGGQGYAAAAAVPAADGGGGGRAATLRTSAAADELALVNELLASAREELARSSNTRSLAAAAAATTSSRSLLARAASFRAGLDDGAAPPLPPPGMALPPPAFGASLAPHSPSIDRAAVAALLHAATSAALASPVGH